MGIQIETWKEAIGWLPIQPKFVISVLILVLVSILITKKEDLSYKIRVLIASLILFFYMCKAFNGVLGTPTLIDFYRISGNGEKLFNPDINIIHYTGPLNLTFMFNVLVFVPIGILCPIISETYGKLKYTILFGFSVSLLIELSHLFTSHKETNINELVANVIGICVGFGLLKLISRVTSIHFGKILDERKSLTWVLPIIAVLTAFVYNFFS